MKFAFTSSLYPGMLLACLLFFGSFSTGATGGWKIEFDGSGSNPVVVDGVLYVGSADGAVYAFDAATAKSKWRFQTGAGMSSLPQVITVARGTGIADQMATAINTSGGQTAAAIKRLDMTPLVDSGTVFIGSGDHVFYAIDALSGETKWSYLAGGGMASSNNTAHPVPAAVTRKGVVYFVTEDGLHALDALSGKRQWLFETLQEVPAEQLKGRKRTPSAPVPGDGVIFLTAWPFRGSGGPALSYLYAIDDALGSAKWVTALDGSDITTPVVARGIVCVSTGATLHAIDTDNGQLRWRLGGGKKLGTPRLLAVDGTIYFATDRKLLAANAETGQPIWSFDAERIEGNLKADNEHLYVITWKQSMFGSKSTLHALARDTGQQQWSQVLSGHLNQLAIYDGVIYGVGESYLHAIDAATGKSIWSYKGVGALSAPIISGKKIFMSSPTVHYIGSSRVDQGYLFAIDAATGKP